MMMFSCFNATRQLSHIEAAPSAGLKRSTIFIIIGDTDMTSLIRKSKGFPKRVGKKLDKCY